MSTSTLSNQELSNERFNAEAATWDANKTHAEGVTKAYEAIRRNVPVFGDGSSRQLDVLEIGCGTGLLSFQLAPHVRSLVGIDTSTGMIDAFNAKTAAVPDAVHANLAAVNVLVHSADDVHLQGACAALAARRGESGRDVPYRFDLVVSHLTLHHIAHLPELVAVLKDCLRPGGMLALTDYEDFGPEAVAFHAESKRQGVERHGIKKGEIEDIIDGVGFNEVAIERAFELRKEVDGVNGGPKREMHFPFLICLAKK